MAFRYSLEVRNAGLDARIAAVGPAPVLNLYDGKTVLVAIKLPDIWMTKAENGVVKSVGRWTARAIGKGVANRFRFDGHGWIEGHLRIR